MSAFSRLPGRHRVSTRPDRARSGPGSPSRGTLLTAEQFDGPDGQGRGAAAAYRVNADGSLDRTSKSVHNGGTETCWFVVTDAGRYGFTASFFGPGRLSSCRIGADGSLRLLKAKAAGRRVKQGASDLSLSADSRSCTGSTPLAGPSPFSGSTGATSVSSTQFARAVRVPTRPGSVWPPADSTGRRPRQSFARCSPTRSVRGATASPTDGSLAVTDFPLRRDSGGASSGSPTARDRPPRGQRLPP